MNPCEIVSASTTGHLSFINFPVKSVVESNYVVQKYTNTIARNRYGRVITLFPSQCDIIDRITNPFRIARIEANIEMNDATVSVSTNVFPCARIVNLPTGIGKTVVSALGALESLRLHKHLFESALENFISSLHVPTSRGTIHTTLFNKKFLLLPNVLYVFAPKHLIGQWRDTIQQNVFGHDSVHVFPHNTSFNLLSTDFSTSNILSKPNETFVYVTHVGNFKKLIVTEENVEIVAGVAIFDEADSELFPCMEFHKQIPVAMHTLLITATPGKLLSACSHRPTSLVSHCLSGGPSSLSCFADLVAMQLVLPFDGFRSNITNELSSTIPDLHSYRVRTRAALARTFGATANDLENPRTSLERVERDLEIRIYGQTIEAIQEQIREHINTLSVINKRTKIQDIQLDRLQSTMRRVLEIDGFCGICMEDFSNANSLRLTSCCGFFICPSCHERVSICAKCRNPNVKYFDIVASTKSTQTTTTQTTLVALQHEKDVAGFEGWVRSFQFAEVDQLTALNEITSNAMRFGLTHLIFAGAGVDSWSGLGVEANTFFAYEIIRPVGHTLATVKKTAKRLDTAYRKFCSGERPAVLILDSRRNDSVELTGIDAGVTDLIVQVGTDAGGSAYTQLAGRAMRFGRNPTNPVRIIMA